MTSQTMTATKVSNHQAPKRNRFDAVKRMLPRRSAKLVTGLVLLGAVLLFAIIVPFFGDDPNAISDIGLTAPSAQHLLGTTMSGQDVFMQLAYATRGSLIIGFSVAIIATILSGIFGILGTYVGGIWDDLLALITNVMLVIPGLPLTIVIAVMSPTRGIAMVIIVLAITSWAGSARVLRAQTLSMRGRDYVLAAKISGERPWRVIVVEILPNLLPCMASQFVFAVIFAILGESSLSFIGLGASGQLTLGTMLYYSQNAAAINIGAWWWFIPPGVVVAIIGAGLSFIDFPIDEVINPKLRTLNAKPAKSKKAKVK